MMGEHRSIHLEVDSLSTAIGIMLGAITIWWVISMAWRQQRQEQSKAQSAHRTGRSLQIPELKNHQGPEEDSNAERAEWDRQGQLCQEAARELQIEFELPLATYVSDGTCEVLGVETEDIPHSVDAQAELRIANPEHHEEEPDVVQVTLAFTNADGQRFEGISHVIGYALCDFLRQEPQPEFSKLSAAPMEVQRHFANERVWGPIAVVDDAREYSELNSKAYAFYHV